MSSRLSHLLRARPFTAPDRLAQSLCSARNRSGARSSGALRDSQFVARPLLRSAARLRRSVLCEPVSIRQLRLASRPSALTPDLSASLHQCPASFALSCPPAIGALRRSAALALRRPSARRSQSPAAPVSGRYDRSTPRKLRSRLLRSSMLKFLATLSSSACSALSVARSLWRSTTLAQHPPCSLLLSCMHAHVFGVVSFGVVVCFFVGLLVIVFVGVYID